MMTTSSSSPVRPPNVSNLTPGEQRPPSPALAAVIEAERRSPPAGGSPSVIVRTTDVEHLLSVSLPGFAPEMVTISARKDDTLAVVADLWHAENDCHHEWLVTFPKRDADLSSTRASFSPDGTLTIRVRRLCGYFARSVFL